ncbi:hypothetical protein D9611_010610 [Ephemerocybe angulata]|uniref:Uncharacterized protein n=1 Tax=Ephemerocybe angulata TaxID=980116 RepID=A0A8H5BVX8_9AGAR|nr:hypothetical protein D9611_010610 [Tulosesus angulatus]
MSTHPHNPTSLIASASHSNAQSTNDTANQSTSPSSKIENVLQETLSTLTDSLGSILSPNTTEVHEKVRNSEAANSRFRLGGESRAEDTASKHAHAGPSSRNLKAEVEHESGDGALGFF